MCLSVFTFLNNCLIEININTNSGQRRTSVWLSEIIRVETLQDVSENIVRCHSVTLNGLLINHPPLYRPNSAIHDEMASWTAPKGPHTNRFFHVKRPMDVWGEGVKGLDVFKFFVLSTFFLRIFCQETLFCSIRLLYIFFVQELRQ